MVSGSRSSSAGLGPACGFGFWRCCASSHWCFWPTEKPSTALWTRAPRHRPACPPTTTPCWASTTPGTTSHFGKRVLPRALILTSCSCFASRLTVRGNWTLQTPFWFHWVTCTLGGSYSKGTFSFLNIWSSSGLCCRPPAYFFFPVLSNSGKGAFNAPPPCGFYPLMNVLGAD